SKRVGLITGFDFGTQQKFKGSSTFDYWFTPVIIVQYTLNKSWKTTLRAEYYQDEKGVIIPTGTNNGFSTAGFSYNIDYPPTQNIVCRLEGRWFNSKDNLFET